MSCRSCRYFILDSDYTGNSIYTCGYCPSRYYRASEGVMTTFKYCSAYYSVDDPWPICEIFFLPEVRKLRE